MPHVSAITNQKGGVAKTTSAVNFAANAARLLGNGKVLLIDTDHQANATTVFLPRGVAFGPRDTRSLLDVLEGKVGLSEAAHKVELAAAGAFPATSFDLVPARIELAQFDKQLDSMEYIWTLKDQIEKTGDHYTLVLIDTPPNIGGYLLNALVAADTLIIPVMPGEYEVNGLRSLLTTIEHTKRLNANLKVASVLPTRVKRTAHAQAFLEALTEFFGAEKVMDAIPDRVAIERAHTNHTDVYAYDSTSDGAQLYLEATRQHLIRVGLLEEKDG